MKTTPIQTTLDPLAFLRNVRGMLVMTALVILPVVGLAQSDATLTNLAFSGGALTPVFDGTFSYTATVPFTTNSVTVTPTATDPLAAITVNGSSVTSGNPSGAISLSVGANVITNEVVSVDTTATNVYTITVTRSAPSSNADLSNLVPSAGTLTPSFLASTTNYTATVPYATNSMTVKPTAADANATITVNGVSVLSGASSGAITLSVGDNTITNVVTAQDGITTKTYFLTVTRGIGSTWANSNVTGTPTTPLNWFNSPQGAWTDGTPVSTNTGTIQYFQDTNTALANTVAANQVSTIDNGGVAFQLGTLTLSGRASATASANLTNTITGDPLNFSAATGTINLNGLNNTRTLTYFLNSAIQLGTAGSASALTIAGNGNGTFNIGGNITELQAGGGSLIKSGSSAVTLSGNNSYSGGTTINGGTVTVNTSSSIGTSNITVAGSSTVNISTNLTFANNIAVNAALSMKILMAATANSNIFSGVLSGSSNISVLNNGNNGTVGQFAFNNLNNTFTGDVTMASGNAVGHDQFAFNSIGDGGRFTLQKSGNQNTILYTGSSNIVFNSRVMNLGAISGMMDGGGVTPVNRFANNGSGTVMFTQNLTVGGVGNNTVGCYLFFGGSNNGTNTFAGIIPNSTSGTNLGIGKSDAGKWILTRDNTFLGNVKVSGGTLSVGKIDLIANAQPLGRGPIIELGHQNTAGTLEFTGTTASTTDKQVQMGNQNSNSGNAGGATILNNGSGSLTFSNTTFNPTVSTVTATRPLTLGGTYSGSSGANEIQGTIQNNTNSGAVSLIVSGSVWKLSGNSTYRGTTAVNAGTLLVNGDNSALTNTVTVANGATLGGTGTLGGRVTCNAGAGIAPGSIGTAGTLTLTNGLTLNAGVSLAFTLTNATPGAYSQVAITGGNFVPNSVNSIQLAADSIPTGTYILITNVNARTLTATNPFVFSQTGTTNWTVGGATLTLLSGANSVVLEVSGGPVVAASTAVNWRGGANGTWDTSTANWLSNSAAVTYADGQNVFFNDSAVNFTVTNGAGFSPNPGAVTFNNNLKTYTVSVAIQGAGNVTNAGSGTSILSGNNTYTGTTYVNSGVLRIASPTALGGTAGGTVVSSGAELSCNTTLTNSGESLTLSGSGAGSGAARVGGNRTWTWDGPVTLASDAQVNADTGSTLVLTGSTVTGANTTLTTAGGGACNIASSISLGTGSVKVIGAGPLTLLNGGNSFSGGLIHQGSGTVTVSAAGAQGSGDVLLDGSSGSVAFAGFDGPIVNNIISTNGGTGGVTKSGPSTNILTGNNNYVGTTTISSAGGALVAIAPSAFGSSTNIVVGANSALSLRGDSSSTFVKLSDSTPYTVTLNSANYPTIDVDQATLAGTSAKTMTIGLLKCSSTAGNITNRFTGANNTSLSVGAVTGTLRLSATPGTISYDNAIASPGTLTLSSYTSQTYSVGGETVFFSGTGDTIILGGITNSPNTNAPLGAPLAVVKDGSGTLTLQGAAIYTGNTVVNGGTLLVNGSLDAASAVTVNTNGILGGTGIVGAVTVADGGNLAPGASPGTLTVSNLDLTGLASGTTGKLFYELGPLAGPSDLTAVTGTLTIGTNLLGFSDFAFTNLGGLQNGTYTLITNSGSLNSGDALDLADTNGAIGSFNAYLQLNGANLELVVSGAGPVTPSPTLLTNVVSGTTLSLSWPAGQGWRLQEQTNSRSVGLRTNWVYVTDSSVSSTNITVDKITPTTFYRLMYP